MRGVLSARETAIWTVGFLLVATVIVATGFTSSDPDSALYANIADRLSEEPIARWVAPEWWGFWPEARMTGLFREHPAGIFWLPAALARFSGIPAIQGAYIVGVLAGLLSLVLIGVLAGRVCARDDARAALLLLQFMPVAFIFRIRANHEYLMLLCLLLVLLGLDRVKRSTSAWWLVAAGLAGGLLVKGVFVSLILLGGALWIALDPRRDQKGTQGVRRQLLAFGAGLLVMVALAATYDALYLRATGERFWSAYWARQMGPLTIASPWQDAAAIASRLGFYVTRLLWHPAPWSLALLWLALTRFGTWRDLPLVERRALAFSVTFVVLAVAMLSLPSRFAERYAFSATFVVGTVGAVAARRAWTPLGSLTAGLDGLVPALPAVVWTLLSVGRLVLGPYLPRF